MAKFEKLKHPLGWGDVELSYMIGRNINPTNGKVMNLTVIYRLMGYSVGPGGSVPAGFRERVRRLQDNGKRDI